MNLFRVFSKAPSTAEEVEGALLFSACFQRNKPKTEVLETLNVMP